MRGEVLLAEEVLPLVDVPWAMQGRRLSVAAPCIECQVAPRHPMVRECASFLCVHTIGKEGAHFRQRQMQ